MGTLLGFLSSMGVGYSTQIPSADALNTMSDASEIGRKELEQMVSALQEVESGRLSEHKWMDMCGEIGFGTTRQFRRDFFRLFADSGKMFVKEFAVYCVLLHTTSPKQMVAELAKVFDPSGSGLDERDIKTLFVMIAMAIKRCNFILPGLVGEVGTSPPDFLLKKDEKKPLHRHPAQLFAEVDVNNDGIISTSEFKQFLKSPQVADVANYFTALTNALPKSRPAGSIPAALSGEEPRTRKSSKGKKKRRKKSSSSTKKKQRRRKSTTTTTATTGSSKKKKRRRSSKKTVTTT